MADVKWIKITTDIFSDEKILLIEQMPDADTILVIWFKLLCMAGRDNNNGIFLMNNKIPYTEEMLATLFRRPLNTVRLAVSTFEAFGMIEIIDDVITLANWEKHQNVEGMNKIREQTRKRMQDYRARQRMGIAAKGESCVYCGKPADTIDHLIPRSKGGMDVADNLVPCCKSCNSSKKDKDLADFLNDSFYYTYQNVNHNLVRLNPKIMNIVSFDGEQYVMLRNSDAIDKNKIRIEEDKNNILSDSDESEAPPTKKVKVVKHKYGEYKNVLLTDEELDKLKAEYPDYQDRIERVSSYVASTGKSYKSHYATIRNWARKDAEKPTKKNTFNGFENQRDYDMDKLEAELLRRR